MSEFKLVREDQDDVFAEIELLYCPRRGEEVWIEQKHANGATHYVFRVQGVMHVVETDEEYAHVQLTVKEISRDEAPTDEEEADLDERGCECGMRGTISPETRARIAVAALKELHRKQKMFGDTGMAPKVEM